METSRIEEFHRYAAELRENLSAESIAVAKQYASAWIAREIEEADNGQTPTYYILDRIKDAIYNEFILWKSAGSTIWHYAQQLRNIGMVEAGYDWDSYLEKHVKLPESEAGPR